jgi:hypothetical protein
VDYGESTSLWKEYSPCIVIKLRAGRCRVGIAAGETVFFLLQKVLTRPRAHPAFYSVRNGGFPQVDGWLWWSGYMQLLRGQKHIHNIVSEIIW